jgi:6-phosphofructokinase 2
MTILTVTLNPCVDKSFSVARVVPDRKLAARRVRRDPGGGGINVARVTARLGGHVEALWTCGGRVGDLLAGLLADEGVPNEPVRIADEVRENLIVEDELTGQQYRFGLPGPILDEAECTAWLTQLRDRPTATEFVVVSGSLPPGVTLEWFAELLRAAPHGARLVVDSKPAVLARAMAVGVYLIKPNLGELGELVGTPLHDDEHVVTAARGLIERGGTEVVLVSLGRGGALLVSADTIERFSAPTVPLASKVGAGDSLVGALVAALARGDSLGDAVARGVAAGAAAVMTEGTELCRREDVERLVPRVARSQVSAWSP